MWLLRRRRILLIVRYKVPQRWDFSGSETFSIHLIWLILQEDEKRKLTPLGREQAALTGRRLATLLNHNCNITHLRVSNMTRARETASIIARYLPGVPFVEPDPKLNEGRPAHHIPTGPLSSKLIETLDDNHPRIEESFERYFYRGEAPAKGERNPQDGGNNHEKHEFEIIVCHANVIRYFLCRALQLPPEAWLRYCPFNCSLTYVTIRPSGNVSCRMLGDVGHMPYAKCSFSKHEGFEW